MHIENKRTSAEFNKNERNLILSIFYSHQISIIKRKLIYLNKKFFFSYSAKPFFMQTHTLE